MNIPVKPRVLIADDSRIVRATLIKHIEGMFDFREALDGEQAWETLLVDSSIRVLITDLTMPKLDGYGLLHRIRTSKIRRIRELPVVVVSGSDEQEERERAKAAGASDLITKGIGTAQLLSRLDVLTQLVGTQREFERSLEALVRDTPIEAAPLPTGDILQAQAQQLLVNAVRSKRNFVILNVRVGLRQIGGDDVTAMLPAAVVDAIGQLLRRTVRQSDLVSKTGAAEFTLVTGSINFDAARSFAQRVCRAIAHADLAKDSQLAFVASCGLVSLSEDNLEPSQTKLSYLQQLASRRAQLGLERALTGVVGREEESALQRGDLAIAPSEGQSGSDAMLPDLATLVQWIKEGRRDDVLPHLGELSAELKHLVNLLLKQNSAA